MISATPDNLVISDTSCLVLLTNIDELDLLRRCYDRILITPEVATEYGIPLPEWIEIRSPSDRNMQQVLLETLDLGEATALSLAWELRHYTVIIDDLKARKAGIRMGLRVTGTIGVIVRAKQKGILTQATPILAKVQQTNFRVSDNVIAEAIREAGE
ncbi:DUF3368 domain-containing protein [Spirosoma rhododendri]|uniref:DUF3368 domain-containing protein n=1 Tax=Spirosoma rhododendri TaxID=2728024 RepID=A0A7L5DQ54_9BACT|nr:DUF3368 domain-containing protein [Spirosoma rhododendri]QJD79702.1 DUF3368 domain-containing protein [Spirosoma rhododendri]